MFNHVEVGYIYFEVLIGAHLHDLRWWLRIDCHFRILPASENMHEDPNLHIFHKDISFRPLILLKN